MQVVRDAFQGVMGQLHGQQSQELTPQLRPFLPQKHLWDPQQLQLVQQCRASAGHDLECCVLTAYLLASCSSNNLSDMFVMVSLHRRECKDSVTILPLCELLQRLGQPSSSSASAVSQVRMALYVQSAPSASLLLCLPTGEDGQCLCRVSLCLDEGVECEGLRFSHVDYSPCLQQLAQKSGSEWVSALRWRRLEGGSNKAIVALFAQGERGLVLLCDASSRVMVVDLENDEDEVNDEEDEGPGEKEEGSYADCVSSVDEHEFADCEEY